MLQSRQDNPGQMALGFAPERHVFQVAELNAEVQGIFERRFTNVWVAGEVASCRVSNNGHTYFALKDKEAQLKCVIFKSTARYSKIRLQDGLAVIARGNLEVYAARGEFQLIVEAVEPQGAGALQLAFEQLKKKLAEEGLFETSRKRPLPRLPRRIGLVTSPSGAVLRDILHVLERRFPGLQIRLFPAQVQGEGSVQQICAGLRSFSQTWAEVVIVARGGGSLEDLWSFNEEEVARAVAACRVPVISAIGHETDFTICDFVADLRAPTPSAAAELVIPTRQSLLEQIDGCRTKMTQSIRLHIMTAHRRLGTADGERSARLIARMVTRRAQQLDEADARLRRRIEAVLGKARRELNDYDTRLRQNDLRLRLARSQHRNQQMRERLERWPRSIRSLHERTASIDLRLQRTIQERLTEWNSRLERASAHLRQLSPLAILQRGYAIVEHKSGRAVRASSETETGEPLRVRLGQGGLHVTVDSYTEE